MFLLIKEDLWKSLSTLLEITPEPDEMVMVRRGAGPTPASSPPFTHHPREKLPAREKRRDFIRDLSKLRVHKIYKLGRVHHWLPEGRTMPARSRPERLFEYRVAQCPCRGKNRNGKTEREIKTKVASDTATLRFNTCSVAYDSWRVIYIGHDTGEKVKGN